MPNTIKKFPVKTLLTFPKDHIRSADTFVELMFEKKCLNVQVFHIYLLAPFQSGSNGSMAFSFSLLFIAKLRSAKKNKTLTTLGNVLQV